MPSPSDLSRILSHALRHSPDDYGVQWEKDGWVHIEDLVEGIRHTLPKWSELTAEEVYEVVAFSRKGRFEIDAGRIRAKYGHSMGVDLGLKALSPPEVLFHGTQRANLGSIAVYGLLPIRRQFVHLSTDVRSATEVARRKGANDVILTVMSGAAYKAGTLFYNVSQTVWLCVGIPAVFLLLGNDVIEDCK